MSKARAWFEIKRFFDGEPQRHYSASDTEAWRSVYAKELILKAALHRLQEDGFVVIDAILAPEYFARLSQRLLLDAPEQAAALTMHARERQAAKALGWGWIGDEEQENHEEHLSKESLVP